MRHGTRFTFVTGLFSGALVFALAATAQALTFDVLTKADKPDAVIDGVCADVDGICTLRAAIQEANAHPGEDIINIIGAKDQKFVLKLVGASTTAARSAAATRPSPRSSRTKPAGTAAASTISTR